MNFPQNYFELTQVQQTDEYKCEIFVFHFIECRFKNNCWSHSRQLKKELKFLLENSEDMKHRCLKCGKLIQFLHQNI